ncbi:MAG TPA: hypothetical protein VFJ17_04510 [Mycobacteriales bacterium]|nr:hypothetical protein [Mycobacteriales bacterium]
MTRIVIGGLAACWLAVALSAWRNRRRDVARHMPVRWHRAVATLNRWSAGCDDDLPVAATWCRPLVKPLFVAHDLPQQRGGVADESVAELSGSPRR